MVRLESTALRIRYDTMHNASGLFDRSFVHNNNY